MLKGHFVFEDQFVEFERNNTGWIVTVIANEIMLKESTSDTDRHIFHWSDVEFGAVMALMIAGEENAITTAANYAIAEPLFKNVGLVFRLIP